MDRDVASLQQELEQLRQQRFEAGDRLRSLAPRGRGFLGAGRGRGPGHVAEEQDRGYPGRGYPNGPAGRGTMFRGPPPMRGGFGMGRGFHQELRPRFLEGPGPQHNMHRMPMRDRLGPNNNDHFFQPEVPQPAPRKRVLSAVVVDGEQRVPGQTASQEVVKPEPATLKRPASSDLEEAPAAKKRNQRMFGALLGTLQKFRTEQAQHEQTEGAKKQADALKRAEERRIAESQRLKDHERAERQAKRQEELARIRDLSLQAEMKVLEIMYAKRIAYRKRLQHFLSTSQSPPLFWLPAKSCPQVERLFEQQQDKFLQWQEEQLEALQGEKDQLRQQDEARRVAAVRVQPSAQHQAPGATPGRLRLESAVVTVGPSDGDEAGGEGEGEEDEEREQREAEAIAEEDGETAATNGEQGEDATQSRGARVDEAARDDDRYVADADQHVEEVHEEAERSEEMAGVEEDEEDNANTTSVEDLLR